MFLLGITSLKHDRIWKIYIYLYENNLCIFCYLKKNRKRFNEFLRRWYSTMESSSQEGLSQPDCQPEINTFKSARSSSLIFVLAKGRGETSSKYWTSNSGNQVWETDIKSDKSDRGGEGGWELYNLRHCREPFDCVSVICSIDKTTNTEENGNVEEEKRKN